MVGSRSSLGRKPGSDDQSSTNAIQALLKEWEPWCDVDYVVDPENFLGDPNYLIQTLTYVPHSVNFNELSALDPMDSKVAAIS